MFRIDGPSAVVALPAPAAVGTPGYFAHATPGVSPATTMGADWANMVQEEIIAVVLAAGETPDKANHTQLLAALRSLFVAASPGGTSGTVLATPGKRVFADGYTELWGVGTLPSGEGSFTLTLPFGGFPTACLGITCMVINSSSTPTGDTQVQEVTLDKSAPTLFAQNQINGSLTDAAGGFRFKAWGY